MDYRKTNFNDLRDALHEVWIICGEEERNIDITENEEKIGNIIWDLEKRIEECCDCLNSKKGKK